MPKRGINKKHTGKPRGERSEAGNERQARTVEWDSVSNGDNGADHTAALGPDSSPTGSNIPDGPAEGAERGPPCKAGGAHH